MLLYRSLFLFVTATMLVAVILTYPRSSVSKIDFEEPYHYSRVMPEEPIPEVGVAYLVADVDTGEVLLSHNASIALPIASLTKLLLAGILSETTIDWSATTTIEEADLAALGDYGKLTVGDVYSLRELLFPYLLESSNDAGMALTKLVPNWTQYAQAYLQQNSLQTDITLADTTGLADANKATARALAKASILLSQEAPHIYDISQLDVYRGAHANLVNNNPIKNDFSYLGGKHGYTEAAGKTLIAHLAVNFADGEREVVFVVLGTDDYRQALSTLHEQLVTTIIRNR